MGQARQALQHPLVDQLQQVLDCGLALKLHANRVTTQREWDKGDAPQEILVGNITDRLNGHLAVNKLSKPGKIFGDYEKEYRGKFDEYGLEHQRNAETCKKYMDPASPVPARLFWAHLRLALIYVLRAAINIARPPLNALANVMFLDKRAKRALDRRKAWTIRRMKNVKARSMLPRQIIRLMKSNSIK